MKFSALVVTFALGVPLVSCARPPVLHGRELKGKSSSTDVDASELFELIKNKECFASDEISESVCANMPGYLISGVYSYGDSDSFCCPAEDFKPDGCSSLSFEGCRRELSELKSKDPHARMLSVGCDSDKFGIGVYIPSGDNICDGGTFYCCAEDLDSGSKSKSKGKSRL